jgi:hypothetical protein
MVEGNLQMKKALLGAVFATLLCATAALAHHSFAGTYEMDQTLTIRGTITGFTLRNPHSFVTVDVQYPIGPSENWGIEWSSISALRTVGIDQNILKVGDKVVITGNVAKGLNKQLLMKRIERADGRLVWEGTVGNKKQSP